jgi:hypothetical protein
VLLLAASLLYVPVAHAGEQAPALPGPGASIFTVAGGGTDAPRVGRVATDVRLHPREAVYLPDGRIVIRDDEHGSGGRLQVVDADGRIGALPPFPPRPAAEDRFGEPLPFAVFDIDVEADGGLLAVVTGEPGVLRLGPGGWTAVATPAGVDAVAALPDGTLAVLADGVAWWLARDGTFLARRALSTSQDYQSVTPLADGSLFASTLDEDPQAVRFAREGPLERLRRLGAREIGFGALPDGSLLAASGPVSLVAPGDGARRALYGSLPTVGSGDGGPAERALLVAAGVAPGPPGAVLISEPQGVRHDRPVTRNARRTKAGAVLIDLDARYSDSQIAGAVRWVGPAPPGRLLAALTPAIYRRLAAGRVPISTSIGGHAKLVVRTNRRVVATAQAPVPAGNAQLRLEHRLRPGYYELELRVTNGSRVVVQRLGVATHRTLAVREGARAIRHVIQSDGGGDGAGGHFFRATPCRRASSTQVVCQYIAVDYFDDGTTLHLTPYCAGTVSAHLRGDGVRVVRSPARLRRCPSALQRRT